MTSEATDIEAGRRVAAVVPIWDGQARARELLGDRRVVLHAGPPFSSWADVPQPVRNSLVFGVMYEGWATSSSDAEQLLSSGDVPFEAAQDHDIVIPLSGVCAPSMALHRISDRNNPAAVKYAVINEGMKHMTRVGIVDDQLFDHHRWLNGHFSERLARICDQPLELLPMMEDSLTRGDDCHAATAAGSRAVGEAAKVRCALDGASAQFLDESPAFALNLWMAASALRLAAAEGVSGSSFITRAAGNGHLFGVQLAARPGVWHTVRATPPVGTPDAGQEGFWPTGALGDSAVVEFAGYGGMAIDVVPERAAALKDNLPHGAVTRASTLHAAAFGDAVPVRSGLTAASVVRTGVQPYVLLGMIESTGARGRIGGGVFEVPAELFSSAVLSDAAASGVVT